jgi:hypothetical protein
MAELVHEIRTNQAVTEARLADLSENVESVLQKQAEYMHMIEQEETQSKQDLVDLIRVRQRSIENTEHEWHQFFQPILANLQRVVKRRIFHVIEEKLNCEKKMAEGDPPVTSSDFDLEQEWSVFEYYLRDNKYGQSYGLDNLSTLKVQLQKSVSHPDEIPLAFYYSISHHFLDGRMAEAYSFMYVVTTRSVYELSRRSSSTYTKQMRVSADGIVVSNPYSSFGHYQKISVNPGEEQYIDDNHFLVYRFERPLTKQLAKIIIKYIKTKRKPVRTRIANTSAPHTPLNGDREFVVREREAFEALLTSIPGTYYYPLKPGWKSVEAEDGSMTYTNTKTREVSYDPPYQEPPEVYE